MKTLTYGTLPSNNEIIAAVKACHVSGHYGMNLNQTDRVMFVDLCPHGTLQNTTGGKWTFTLNPSEVVNLLQSLTCIADNEPSHGEPWSDSECEWAGHFCSSILSTLGFEWV